MAVGKRQVNGQAVWVIDRRFRRLSDGRGERYRRVAEVQTRAAAEAEARRVCDYYAEHGNITALLVGDPSTPKAKVKTWTWEDAVEHYRKAVLPQRKPSVRASYDAVLSQPLLVYWQGKALTGMTKPEQRKWELWARESCPNNGTRMKHHIVLRAVLRSVGPDEETGEPGVMLVDVPQFIPLPRPDRKAIEVPHPEDIDGIMGEGRDGRPTPKHCRIRSIRRAQLAFALAIWAGLRAGEVRALKVSDIDVRRLKITVRRSRCEGEETVTKGRAERTVDIAEPLWGRIQERLAEIREGEDAYVSVNMHGQPWGDWGIYQAFCRACERLKIKGSRYHACRHYFATALIEGGADVVTVQHLLGHQELSTTQRYAHFVESRGKAAVAVFTRPRATAAE